jgi:hypothetical protein
MGFCQNSRILGNNTTGKDLSNISLMPTQLRPYTTLASKGVIRCMRWLFSQLQHLERPSILNHADRLLYSLRHYHTPPLHHSEHLRLNTYANTCGASAPKHRGHIRITDRFIVLAPYLPLQHHESLGAPGHCVIRVKVIPGTQSPCVVSQEFSSVETYVVWRICHRGVGLVC